MSIKELYPALALASLALSSFFILSSSPVSADDASVDDVVINVPISCTMSSSGENSHTATVPNNTTRSDIGTTTVNAFCNDTGGFAIYAIGYTDETYGKTVLASATLGSTKDIATGTATSGSTSNWAMKLTNTGTTYPVTIQNSFGSYHSVPSAYTLVASRTSGTAVGTGATGATFTTTYRAFISSTQPADTYTGKVKYTMVHPASEVPLQPQTATSGCINYFANASTAVGTMGCQTVSTSATSANLLSSNFSRAGYGFAGWSDSFDYATNANAKFYGPQEKITFAAGQYTGSNSGLALYAVWVQSAGTLQDTPKVIALCGSNGVGGTLTIAPTDGTANLSSVSALTDLRDNQTYAIARLADGKCWMIENLRLEAENTRTAEKQTLAQGYGTSTTYGNFGGLADAEQTFPDTYAANSLYYSGTQQGTANINIGTSNDPGYRMPRYNNINNQSTSTNRPQNPTTNSATNSTTNAGMYSYGNYYTWHAAIADLTYNGTLNNSTTSTSLCPAGWHLPTGGLANANGVNVTGNPSTFREFYNLGYELMDEIKTAYQDQLNSGNSYYASTTNTAGKNAIEAFKSFPNNFLYSGAVNASSIFNRGSAGLYWSSTADTNTKSYGFYFYSNRAAPGTWSLDKSKGYSIRCVANVPAAQ
ncbi:hypothetical protein IKG33_00810 [Candidatus Saccharibacteria bacterium]|nr:hypothetical protein [Candidatus Saccharibacteria bacterium]